jgi:phenylpyruvate tautomerase PptA (4-oxalocrotonate tautomerase family)
LRSAPRASIETPFVQMVLMKGRSTAQYQAVMDAASDVIARELGLDKARVRVHLAQAEPDFWAIGGTPYAVLRADEMAARERATA